MFIQFHGATKEGDEFIDRGPVCVSLDVISVFYDHTIMCKDGNKIRVMETFDAISALINAAVEVET